LNYRHWKGLPFLCCNEVEKVNKTELKNFAIQSRRQLIDQVKTKALMYGIDEKNDLEIQEQFGVSYESAKRDLRILEESA